MAEKMYSFYGGQPGQPFTIKQVFTSYHGASNSLAQDVAKGWNSPISVGEFVVISYGEPQDDSYEEYRNIDLAYGEQHNWTLWQKVYDESVGNVKGISYKLIGSLTGNTPKIVVETPATVLDADEEPAVYFYNENTTDDLGVTHTASVDEPHIEFRLPQSQVLQYVTDDNFNVLDAGQTPAFWITYPEKADGTTDINKPTLNVSIPQSQVISVESHDLDADESPTVRVDDGTHSGDISDINSPVIHFSLPLSQVLQYSSASNLTILDADGTPNFYITYPMKADGSEEDVNKPTINVELPQAQVMDDPTLTSIGPSENPSVEDIGTVNSPKLHFSLPRAVKFYYGSLLGEKSAGTYTLTNDAFAEYSIGDYYINANTGFIYIVTNKVNNTNECTFSYVARLQAPLPTVDSTGIDAYVGDATAGWGSADPSVTSVYEDADEETGWKLTFNLPKIPSFSAEVSSVAPLDTPTVSVAPTAANNVGLKFAIPRGSQLFGGTDNPLSSSFALDGADAGDLYLKTDTGELYQLAAGGMWSLVGSGLKGDKGDSVNIVAQFEVKEDHDYDNTTDTDLNTGVAVIEEKMGSDYQYSSDELFIIQWTNTETNTVSYRYFYITEKDSKWSSATLTGSAESLVIKEYDSGNSEVKAYSANYVNNLIGSSTDNKSIEENRTAYSKAQIDSTVKTINQSIADNKTEVDNSIAEINQSIENIEANIKTWGTFDIEGLHFE